MNLEDKKNALETPLSPLEATPGNSRCALSVPEPSLSDEPLAGLDPKPLHGALYFIDEFQHALEEPREAIC